jgi:REP element-mobilizing transposase RayT
VSEGREHNHDTEYLSILRDQSSRIAAKKGHRISALSALPDHLHLALRGNVEETPEAIALTFMNNLAYAHGQRPVWRCGYYVGTFGEYDTNAVRDG